MLKIPTKPFKLIYRLQKPWSRRIKLNIPGLRRTEVDTSGIIAKYYLH